MASSALSILGEQKKATQLKSNNSREVGMTLIEIILVVAIISVITRLAYGIFVNMESRVSVQTSVDTLMADIRNQRQEAMLGYSTTSVASLGAGVYFHEGESTYTLFACSETSDSCSYSDQNETNIVQQIQEGIVFADINLEGGVVLFERKRGEIINYDPAKNSFAIKNTSSGKKINFQFSEIGSAYVVE